MPDVHTQRPAALLRFAIRLEDDGMAEDDEAISEDAPFGHAHEQLSEQRAAAVKAVAAARASGDAKAVAQARSKQRQIDRQLAAQKAGSAPPPTGQPDPFALTDLTVVPLDVDLELNGFRQADKVAATFPFSDLPLTSRIIRSCLVELYMGTVPITAFADPADWKLPIDSTTIMFRGYVDEWKTEHKDGESVVRIEARSMEAILMDQKVNKLAPIFQVGRIEDADDPKKVTILDNELITHYLNRFFSTLPNANGALGGDSLVAKFNARGRRAQEPRVNRKLFIRALQTAQSQNQAAGALPGQAALPQPLPEVPPAPGTAEGFGAARVQQPHPSCDTSAWDIVTIACELAGCIPVYDPSIDPGAILIQLPQTIYDDAAQTANPEDGFSRELVDPDTRVHLKTPFRLFVWGRNVKEMSTSRKLGRIKAPAVRVFGYNPDAAPDKRQLVAKFPSTKRATRVGATGHGKTDEIITKVVGNVRSQEQLEQIAVGLYHQIARHESSVCIATDSLTSYQDPTTAFSQDPDLLRLRPGAAVRVLVARYSQDPDGGLNLTPLSDAFGQDPQQIRNFLANQFRTRAKDASQQQSVEKMANKLASVAAAQRTRNLFYVRTANHKFNKDTGWSLKAEVVTFARVTTDPAQMSARDKATNDKQKLPVRTRGAKQPKTPAQVAADRAATVAGGRQLQ